MVYENNICDTTSKTREESGKGCSDRAVSIGEGAPSLQKRSISKIYLILIEYLKNKSNALKLKA